jgi:hypothetical protein
MANVNYEVRLSSYFINKATVEVQDLPTYLKFKYIYLSALEDIMILTNSEAMFNNSMEKC